MEIGLIDSITFDRSNINVNYLEFKINKCDIANTKLNYKINLVKHNNLDSDILFIEMSNFMIKDNIATIEVKK